MDRQKRVASALKKGDMVMVIAGGNHEKRPNKGKVGKLLRFVGKDKDKVIVEGINYIAKHQKAKGMNQPAGKIVLEGPIHISNVMFYVEKIRKPVRLKSRTLSDEKGSRVRGYIDPTSREFVQI